MKKRWAELRSGVWHTKTMDAYLDSMKAHLKNAAERNFKRWPNLGKGSSFYEEDPLPIKYCRESQILGTGVPIGGFNADTWDGEFEHLRKKTKERMAWMDEQLGFTEPTNPVVTAPVDPEIHEPHWQKDTIPDDTIPDDTVPLIRLKEFGRLSPQDPNQEGTHNLENSGQRAEQGLDSDPQRQDDEPLRKTFKKTAKRPSFLWHFCLESAKFAKFQHFLQLSYITTLNS